jgi:hypothetical protein
MTLVYIDSKYRSLGTFDDFVVNIPNPGVFNKVKLLDCSIPQSNYVFNSTNNIISFSEGATGFTATIPSGNYTSTELVSALPGIFAASGCSGVFTVTYSSITGKLTLTSTVSYSIQFGTANNAYYQLGFQAITYSAALSQTSDYLINLAPPQYLFLDIDNLGLKNCLHSNLQASAGKFPIMCTGVSYTFTNWGSNTNYDCSLSNTINSCSQIKVSLRKSNGSLSGIQNDWAFTLLLC